MAEQRKNKNPCRNSVIPICSILFSSRQNLFLCRKFEKAIAEILQAFLFPGLPGHGFSRRQKLKSRESVRFFVPDKFACCCTAKTCKIDPFCSLRTHKTQEPQSARQTDGPTKSPTNQQLATSFLLASHWSRWPMWEPGISCVNWWNSRVRTDMFTPLPEPFCECGMQLSKGVWRSLSLYDFYLSVRCQILKSIVS